MADYISSLTGVAMDAALLDMAEHTSEAYAIGERNGVPVGSDDVAYHNNARYYAQQAQSIAPASVTEAVRWDVAQTALTDAQRLQARENIEATSHNYNLVDNGWFNVNSRNVNGAVSGGQTGLDRWVVNASASNSVTMATGSITLPSAGYEVIQYLNDMTSTYGKYVTLSVRDNSGSIYSASVVMPTSPSVQNYINSTQNGIRMRLRYMNPYWWVMLDASSAGTDKTITAVKLELGSFSTLENDTLPDYATELARCVYSTANAADAYANTGYAISNPNLLDNGWFTVAQRGSSFTTTGSFIYTADRWQVNSNAGATVTINNRMSITATNWSVRQFFEKPNAFAGKTVTITVATNIPNGNTMRICAYDSATVGGTTGETYQDIISEAGYFRFRVNLTNGLSCVRFVALSWSQSNTTNIYMAKVELGAVSTLISDIAPDYGTELLKCQYYFRRISASSINAIDLAYATSATRADIINAGHSRPMRTIPTVIYSGTINVYNNATNHAVTSTSVIGYNTGFNIAFYTTGLTVGATSFISLNGTIDISADL